MKWYLLVGVLLISMVSTVAGQQTSTNTIVTIERIVAALEAVGEYDSYIEVMTYSETQELTVVSEGEVVLASTRFGEVESQTTIMRDDGSGAYSAVIYNESNGEGSFTIGELRYVDGVLYVATENLPDTSPILPLQEWQTVDDPQSITDFDLLNPSRFLLALEGDYQSPFTDIDLMMELVQETRVRQEIFESQIVSVIDVEFSVGSLATLVDALPARFADDEELNTRIFDFMAETGELTLTVYLGDNDQLLQISLQLVSNAVGVDMHEMDESMPAGYMADISLVGVQVSSFRDVNAVQATISVP